MQVCSSCRRTKNNPILLGEPGVGKTAIAEGLALAIVNRIGADGTPLPGFLFDKCVMQLDVGLLIAGGCNILLSFLSLQPAIGACLVCTWGSVHMVRLCVALKA